MDDAITQCASQYSAETAAAITRLARALPEPQAEELLQLVRTIVGEVEHEEFDAREADLDRVVAHLPGLAPVLALLRAHMDGYVVGEDDCPACKPAP
jgi:hypothetical protein